MFIPSIFAQSENITNQANQPFAILWDSTQLIAGQNATFTVHVFSVKETDYLQKADLTDFYVEICIQNLCQKIQDQFVYELGIEKDYNLKLTIPEKIITNITCESEFKCWVTYDYPSEGIIKIGYKRFDKNFPLVYEDTFKIKHIENQTLPVIFINSTEQPIGTVTMNALSHKFTVNYLMVIGVILFVIGLFALFIRQKWGALFIIAGVVIFVLGVVFT